jgi:hypothetical protein
VALLGIPYTRIAHFAEPAARRIAFARRSHRRRATPGRKRRHISAPNAVDHAGDVRLHEDDARTAIDDAVTRVRAPVCA